MEKTVLLKIHLVHLKIVLWLLSLTEHNDTGFTATTSNSRSIYSKLFVFPRYFVLLLCCFFKMALSLLSSLDNSFFL